MLWDIQNLFRTLAALRRHVSHIPNCKALSGRTDGFHQKRKPFAAHLFFQRLIILASPKIERYITGESLFKIKQLPLQFTIKNLCLSNNFASLCSSSLKFRISHSSPPKEKNKKSTQTSLSQHIHPPPNGQRLVFAPTRLIPGVPAIDLRFLRLQRNQLGLGR